MNEILYIDEPPDSIECIYCRSNCHKEVMYAQIVEYTCHNHGETEVMFRCASSTLTHQVWFFNVIKVTRGDWRISWNFYSGNQAQLEKFIPAEDRKWGSHWRQIHNLPSDFLFSPLKIISSYLNLYRVWS